MKFRKDLLNSPFLGNCSPVGIAASLDDFLQNLNQANNFTPTEARRAIEKGIVEITIEGRHFANGLLITGEGYFLTASHCVNTDDTIKLIEINQQLSMSPPFCIRAYDGNEYPIVESCRAREEEDIALAKADIPGTNYQPTYACIEMLHFDLLRNSNVTQVTRWNGKIKHSAGLISETQSNIASGEGGKIDTLLTHHFTLSDAPGMAGDSGGVIISDYGQLLGFITCGKTEDYITSAVKVNRALHLIERYSQELKKHIGQQIYTPSST